MKSFLRNKSAKLMPAAEALGMNSIPLLENLKTVKSITVKRPRIGSVSYRILGLLFILQ